MPKPPEQGDLVEVQWVDIYEDPGGDPEQAQLARRTSYGIYWCERKDEPTGIPVLITTTTFDDPSLSHQSGHCIYPKACVLKLTVVKRGRRPRAASPTLKRG